MKLTEQQLRDIISETIKESFFGDLYRGFHIDKEEPTDYKGVFARCGYEIGSEQPSKKGDGTLIGAVRKTGAFGAFNGDSPEEVVAALQRLGIKAKYLGQPKDKQYIFAFKILK
jgi:hypothetical protein